MDVKAEGEQAGYFLNEEFLFPWTKPFNLEGKKAKCIIYKLKDCSEMS